MNAKVRNLNRDSCGWVTRVRYLYLEPKMKKKRNKVADKNLQILLTKKKDNVKCQNHSRNLENKQAETVT